MDRAHFRRLCAGLHRLSPRQVSDLEARLSGFGDRMEALAALDARAEPHSRIEDWLASLPEAGLREMCSWERFCAFAREPERRRVGTHPNIRGASYFH